MTVPIAVFDIDGVLVENPTLQSNNDLGYWHKHWTAPPSEARVNQEMVELLSDLHYESMWGIIALTARPAQYADHTEKLLRFILDRPVRTRGVQSVYGDFYGRHSPPDVVLVTQQANEIVPSGEFKRDTIGFWQSQGLDIRFMVEDYKPNADVIRRVLPVLLYERQR